MTDKDLDPLESFRAGVAEIFGIDSNEVEIVVEDGDFCSRCAEVQQARETEQHGGEVTE